jgi:hypothetical protein
MKVGIFCSLECVADWSFSSTSHIPKLDNKRPLKSMMKRECMIRLFDFVDDISMTRKWARMLKVIS